ncbi:hypothetical protein [Pusillimonas sp. ANT_WB101]|uniref:hypothetical protein n=1 Tax=Pusillimonas sp. ANT_WB101 TaxID=2597356 RepID=UPI0011ED8967|nr:hypothetical protein [Pusillimonas sp. ANT_WB101]KAA0892550.1 hypothetical protein FQ179_09530 [Pusillimonas sp. ANT_WB101]
MDHSVTSFSMLRLPRNVTLDFVSDHITKLELADADVIQVPGKIPPDVGFAVTGLVIQLLALWSRTHSERTLQVAGQPVEKILTGLAKEPHGSAAIYFADHIKGAQGFNASASEARRYLIPVIHAMQRHEFRDTSGTRGAHLCCFYGSVNEYIGPLYSRDDEASLRNPSDFIDLTRNAIAAFEPAALRRLSPEALNFISSVVYELFSNTHEHARSDEQGNAYTSGNVRGIIARTVEYREDKKETHINVHLSRYMALAAIRQKRHSVQPEVNQERVARVHAGYAKPHSDRTKSLGSTRFLEFTIYDTGPGLARQWAVKKRSRSINSLTFEDELEFVRECFVVGNTTKKTNGVGRGLGYSVESLKKLGAFMALRTGRVFFYQNFLNTRTDGFVPEHWYPDNQEQAYLPGTTYTIVIPISGDLT